MHPSDVGAFACVSHRHTRHRTGGRAGRPMPPSETALAADKAILAGYAVCWWCRVDHGAPAAGRAGQPHDVDRDVGANRGRRGADALAPGPGIAAALPGGTSPVPAQGRLMCASEARLNEGSAFRSSARGLEPRKVSKASGLALCRGLKHRMSQGSNRAGVVAAVGCISSNSVLASRKWPSFCLPCRLNDDRLP